MLYKSLTNLTKTFALSLLIPALSCSDASNSSSFSGGDGELSIRFLPSAKVEKYLFLIKEAEGSSEAIVEVSATECPAVIDLRFVETCSISVSDPLPERSKTIQLVSSEALPKNPGKAGIVPDSNVELVEQRSS